ncbi:MAG: 3'(2'),5'-bisphosphate nucleotidase CysQ [Bacteroidota bacterium]
MQTTTTDLLTSLVDIAREAGDRILEIYHDESQFNVVDFKADDSPLTKADKASHLAIMAGLERVAPEIPVLSEEGRDISYEERSAWNRFWLVDPLDGTKEFIKRNGEFTVNIALVENGRSVMGVVYVPVTGTSYFAAKGEGAFKQENGGERGSITASEFGMADKNLRIVASRSHMSESVQEYVKQFEAAEIVSMGSSLKFMLVAEGKADIYPRLAPTMEWDTGAAQIVVEEAGGTVINHETNGPLVYNKENLLNPYFIAFGRKG